MSPNELERLFGAFSVFSVLAFCIPLLISIGLIIAIFQINSRLGRLLRLQEEANAQLRETAGVLRQEFIADLATNGPNHQAYLDYLVSENRLTADQAEFIAKQSGQI
ncbi:MAG: hypothetical protein ACK2UK_04105 [Candidatus Promineifilaceae bacterium]